MKHRLNNLPLACMLEPEDNLGDEFIAPSVRYLSLYAIVVTAVILVQRTRRVEPIVRGIAST